MPHRTDEAIFRDANRITPIALFGRLEGPSGRVSNVALKAHRLSKAVSSLARQDSLEQLIKLADEFLTQDHPASGRPIAFVGIGAGPAGDGWEYHHLAGQGGDTSNVPPDKLHSTENIVRIPKLLHEEVSAVYSEKYKDTDMTNREWIQKQPYEAQREYGITVLRGLGIVK